MEQILMKLSEIEVTAKRIMEDADKTKKALSEETEGQCKAFDAKLEKETAAKIEVIRAGLVRDKDAEIAALRQKTEKAFSDLDAFFAKNHERLSEDLFYKILHR